MHQRYTDRHSIPPITSARRLTQTDRQTEENTSQSVVSLCVSLPHASIYSIPLSSLTSLSLSVPLCLSVCLLGVPFGGARCHGRHGRHELVERTAHLADPHRRRSLCSTTTTTKISAALQPTPSAAGSVIVRRVGCGSPVAPRRAARTRVGGAGAAAGSVNLVVVSVADVVAGGRHGDRGGGAVACQRGQVGEPAATLWRGRREQPVGEMRYQILQLERRVRDPSRR
mmetsp:Transcript_26167/g.65047  ORF Transcript_26167/g.65047 Transcript_26167/m.65047 type:complete len:227 (+) Transcript_26167:135-815(+)